jgi:hypothetical protein
MDTVVWSTPAMCMVPTARTAEENKYVTTAGRIKFKVGESGKITFLAPVQVPLPEGRYTLRAHLERRTPDLFGTTIQLRRARRAGGAVETVLSCAGVQGGSVQNNVRFSDSPTKSLKVDLDEFYYWVQVTDVNESPATSDSVDAVLGVGLIRS